MLSKKWLKTIKSLQIKKVRQESGAFLVEGAKSVRELLAADFAIQALFVTPAYAAQWTDQLRAAPFVVETATADELAAAGSLATNAAALAIATARPDVPLRADPGEFVLLLDAVADPGNLGTIVRVADWYGIRKVICSPDTVDFYNPKVIAATMGSFARVRVHYTDLAALLTAHADQPSYGTFLEGEDIHAVGLAAGGYVVMGNESRGIGADLARLIGRRLTIPRFGGAESLNVALATAIVCDNLRRATRRNAHPPG